MESLWTLGWSGGGGAVCVCVCVWWLLPSSYELMTCPAPLQSLSPPPLLLLPPPSYLSSVAYPGAQILQKPPLLEPGCPRDSYLLTLPLTLVTFLLCLYF